jgi:ribosomal protein S6
MRIYELVFILKPDLPEEETEHVIEQMQNAIRV